MIDVGAYIESQWGPTLFWSLRAEQSHTGFFFVVAHFPFRNEYK